MRFGLGTRSGAVGLLGGILALLDPGIAATTSSAQTQISFGSPVSYDVGARVVDLATADVNDDGLADAIVGTGQSIAVMLNNGDGTFGAPTATLTGGSTGRIIADDFNADGIPDVAFCVIPGPRVGIFLSRGDGTFHSLAIYGTGVDNRYPTSIATGDFRRSGSIDLAIVTVGFFGASPVISIFSNAGDGTFTLAHDIAMPDGGVGVASGDFDGNGFSDLASVNANTHGPKTVSVFLNTGDGHFSPQQYAAPSGGGYVIARDLNNDARLDLLLSGGDTSWISVMLNNGNGTFTVPVLYTTGYWPVLAAVADFDGDGTSDISTLIGGASPSPLAILLGTGDGSFPTHTTIGPFPNLSADAIAAADLDLNGAVDLIIPTGPTISSVSVLMNHRLPPVDHGLRLSTSHGGNTGTVTVMLFGSNLQPGSTASMVCTGQPDIAAVDSNVSADQSTLTAIFNLVGAVPGVCDVRVTQPDGVIRTASRRFTIEQGGAPNIWTDLIGSVNIRIGGEQTSNILTGNSGGIDSGPVSVWMSLPAALVLKVPQGTNISFDSVATDGTRLLSIDLPSLPPAQVLSLLVTLGVPATFVSPFQVSVWTVEP